MGYMLSRDDRDDGTQFITDVSTLNPAANARSTDTEVFLRPGSMVGLSRLDNP